MTPHRTTIRTNRRARPSGDNGRAKMRSQPGRVPQFGFESTLSAGIPTPDPHPILPAPPPGEAADTDARGVRFGEPRSAQSRTQIRPPRRDPHGTFYPLAAAK